MQSKLVTQARLLNTLEKLDQHRKKNPVTLQVALILKESNNIKIPNTEIAQLIQHQAWQSVNTRNKKICRVHEKRLCRIQKIQLIHNVSGIVWENVNTEQAPFSFPTVHHWLKPIASDIELLLEFKPKIIQYVIDWVLENKLTVSRVAHTSETLISLSSPNDIWLLSGFYSWAHLYVYADNRPEAKGMHLVLGTGFSDSDTKCLWFEIV
jgi:hypothetical protein